MKRSVAFLAAVCLSTVLSATVASAQYTPSKSPDQPPPQQTPPPPSDAAGDTLRTKAEPKSSPKAPAPVDSMSSAAKARRGHLTPVGNPRTTVLSLALGSAVIRQPDEFNNNFRPSLGAMIGIGARQRGVQVAINFNYNFFLANGTVPNDLNVFMIFADLAYFPLKSTARPYVLVCGGYYRQWIVNLGYTENVLGYGGGAGIEVQLDKTRRLFVEGRYVEGQTRQIEPKVNPDMSNSITIPYRIGVTWEFR